SCKAQYRQVVTSDFLSKNFSPGYFRNLGKMRFKLFILYIVSICLYPPEGMNGA
ncbi:MAG: hypothetical protein ACI809_001209, partial [Candidatus Azotimanducaceae bacterium]